MKFLFVHQNFPAQFLHIIRHLAASKQHEVVFICEPNENYLHGVRKVPYAPPALNIEATHIAARELDNGVRRAEAVFHTAQNLKQLGFEPDIIIGHHGWGEMLSLVDLWPDVPMLGYFEFYYRIQDSDVNFDSEFPIAWQDYPRIRAKNAINHVALSLGKSGQCPTEWQRSTYPDWAQKSIDLLWEGVDLRTCRPDPSALKRPLQIGDMTVGPKDKLVTYVSRDLEPYRGFHVMMRALPELLRTRKDVKVVLVGGNSVSYGNVPASGGSWREVMLAEVGDAIDLDRVVFPGRVPYPMYQAVLQRSDAHVYISYPFVASWSLRESFAFGCPLIGGDSQTVKEFVSHGQNGLLTPCLNPHALTDTILGLLEDRYLTAKLRANARAYAEKKLALRDYLAGYCDLIGRLTGENPMPAGSATEPPPLFPLDGETHPAAKRIPAPAPRTKARTKARAKPDAKPAKLVKKPARKPRLATARV